MQYVTKLLGYQQFAADALDRRVFETLRESNDFTDVNYATIERWLQPFRDAMIQSHAAIYDVLEATDSKQAIAVVKGLLSGSGSKLN